MCGGASGERRTAEPTKETLGIAYRQHETRFTFFFILVLRDSFVQQKKNVSAHYTHTRKSNDTTTIRIIFVHFYAFISSMQAIHFACAQPFGEAKSQ